jgi:hypothetical protein
MDSLQDDAADVESLAVLSVPAGLHAYLNRPRP